MRTKKIKLNKNFILESAYEHYKNLLQYIPQIAGNYNVPGISDYPFYAYFSTLIDYTTILEIGTYRGGSACMLSYNEKNKVITYDIKNFIPQKIDRKNIDFRIGNFMNDDLNYSKIDMICLDVDPHDGTKETEIFHFLEQEWPGGLMVLDDIHNNSGMENFWNNIDGDRHQKIDISELAHGPYGTGLLSFNRKYEVTFE